MNEKTYRAIRHDVVRKRQKENCPSAHHPEEKSNHIRECLKGQSNLRILELFAGEGNLTKIYEEFGQVQAMDKKLKTGDSFREYHRLIADRKTFHVVDADPYGFPNRLLPDLFLLMEAGVLFLTIPMASVNILHDITKTHLFSYFDDDCPSLDQILKRIALFGLCHWRKVEEIKTIKIGRLYRTALSVERIKATEYTGVRNR